MRLRWSFLVTMLVLTFSLGFFVGVVIHLPGASTSKRELPVQWQPLRDALVTQTPVNKDPSSRLVNGVYWTPGTESLVPPGFTPDDLAAWRDALQLHRVVDVKDGCGRMQNRLIQMEDGSKACVRYRINNDQILGDILSFHLSQLLHIFQVPPSVLSLVDPRNATWEAVSGEVAAAQWHHERPVIITPWVDGLSPVFIPKELHGTHEGLPRQLHPTTLANKTSGELRALVQWSDLIIFDYLTANLDRVVNNMFNLQWNADMMISPTHNLEAVSNSGLLVFLDNEAGLLHGYRLLDKYQSYHEALLKALCIFRPETARRVKKFATSKESLGQALTTAFESSEPLHHLLPRLPPKNTKILQSRLNQVYDQIIRCEALYPSR
jgi:four-jointed box protein 1